MDKKILSALIFSLIAVFVVNINASFGLDEPAGKIKIELISPNTPQAKLPKVRVDTKPIVVSGVVPVEINKTTSMDDILSQRYLVEYFMDGDLVYKTYGAVTGGYGISMSAYGSSEFSWLLDTTKYRNGKHKLVVNFWDAEGPSAIGIAYIIIENPLSINQIKEVVDYE